MVKKRRVAPSGSKTVQDRSPSRNKVTNARDKFKGALQDLIHHSEDESGSSDDETWANHCAKRLTLPRKRPQNEAPSEPELPISKMQQPFVMKLFDRSVDLSQFSENSPLYVICRAWMNNQPHQSCTRPLSPPEPLTAKDDVETANDRNDSGMEVLKDVHKMPPPLPLTEDVFKMKVPDRTKQENKYCDILEAIKNEDSPSRETLLKENLTHWNKVRKSWLAASAENEKRFEKSGEILSAMFNKAQKQY